MYVPFPYQGKRNYEHITIIAEDVLVIKDDDHPDRQWSVDISEVDGKYLSLFIVKDTSRVILSSTLGRFYSLICVYQKNLLWVTDLEKNVIGPSMQWEKVVNEFHAEFDVYVSHLLSTSSY